MGNPVVHFEVIGTDPARLREAALRVSAQLADGVAGRRVLVTGAGRGFCAGQDLADRAVAPGQAVDLGESVAKRYNPLIKRLTSLPMPVIARVNGVAAGAGRRSVSADAA